MQLLELDEHALARHGLVVKSTGSIPHATWYRMIKRGQLDLLHPGVARMAGTPRTYTQRIAAAVGSAGGTATASHRSAAHLLGVPVPDCEAWSVAMRSNDAEREKPVSLPAVPVDLTVPGRSRKPKLAGVNTHRPTDGRRLVSQRRHGIRCTNQLRTLVDLGAVAPDLVSQALGHFLATNEVNLDAVAAALGEHGRQGRSGVGPLRRAFDHWAIDAKPADSVLELAFTRLVRLHELPPFEFHPTIEGWEVDFRFVGTNVLIECDGWTTHGLDRQRFERDRRRDDDLTSAGWVVKRFTYRAITTSPSDVARRLRRALLVSRPA